MCVEMPDVKADTNRKAPQLPPCRICGETASGFHYGVNSCGACKGFFLRSLARTSPYTCLSNGHCKIGIETKRRKCCQKCRFDKCLQLGMSKDAIKIGRYTYSKRTQDTLELRQLKSNNPSVTLAVSDILESKSAQQLIQKETDMDQDFQPSDNSATFLSNQTFHNGKTENSPEASTSSSEGERAICSSFSETTLSPDQISVYSYNMAFSDHTPLSMASSVLTPEGDTDVPHSICSLDNHDCVSPGSSFASSCLSGSNNPLNQHYGRMATPENISPKGSGSDVCEGLSSPTFLNDRDTIPDHFSLSNDLTELVSTCQSQVIHHTKTSEMSSIYTHFGDNFETSQINKLGHQQCMDSSVPLHTQPNVDFIKASDAKTNEGSSSHVQKDDLLPLSKILSDSISGHIDSLPFSMKHSDSNEMDTSEGQISVHDSPCSLQQLIQLIDSKGGDNFFQEKEFNSSSLPQAPFHMSPNFPSSSSECQEPVNSDPTGFSFVELLMSKKRTKSNIPLSTVLQASRVKDVQNPASLMAALCGKTDHESPELTRLTFSGQDNLSNGAALTSRPVCSTAFGLGPSSKLDAGSVKLHSEMTPSSSSSQEQTKPKIWDSEFSSGELERWISHLVDYHVANVFDNNTDEEMLLEKHTITSDKFRLEENTFGALRALDWKLYFEVYQSTGLDVDSRIDPLSTFLQGFHNESITAVKFIKKIPGFKQLPLSDQAKLIKGCAHEFQLMSVFKGWDNASRQVTFLPLGLTLTEQDMKKLFSESAFENHIKMASSLQTLNLTLEQIILLKAIVAMAPDREELEAKNTVRQIYWKLINCLLYLLWKQSDEPGRKFAQIISALTELRSYSLVIRQAYSDVQANIELLTKHINIPYIFELFF